MKHKTRTVERTIAHTVDGITEQIEVPEVVHVPIAPKDWDRIVLAGVTGVAVLILLAAVAWSTASIGHLLALVVAAPVAYSAAGVFDTAWIVALAVEWLSRYNTVRSKLPRNIGYVFLIVAMGAVCVNGWLAGSIAVGVIGATISGIAKVVWALVLHYNAKPLDDRTQKWVDKRLAAAGARLALSTVQRQLSRAEELLPEAAPTVTTAEDQDRQADAAIRAALATMPDATPEEIAEQLVRIGFTVDPDTVRALSGPGPDNAGSVRHLPVPGAVTMSDTVRTLVAAGGTDLAVVLAAVRAVHGPAVLEDTVRRTLDRTVRTARTGVGP